MTDSPSPSDAVPELSDGERARLRAEVRYAMLAAQEMRPRDKPKGLPERILGLLKVSFAFAEKTIAELPETELAATADFFGRPMTKQAIMLAIATHAHEHLGQSIAYARTCGVVPPWSAREQAIFRIPLVQLRRDSR